MYGDEGCEVACGRRADTHYRLALCRFSWWWVIRTCRSVPSTPRIILYRLSRSHPSPNDPDTNASGRKRVCNFTRRSTRPRRPTPSFRLLLCRQQPQHRHRHRPRRRPPHKRVIYPRRPMVCRSWDNFPTTPPRRGRVRPPQRRSRVM